jgi:hypothetical protein
LILLKKTDFLDAHFVTSCSCNQQPHAGGNRGVPRTHSAAAPGSGELMQQSYLRAAVGGRVSASTFNSAIAANMARVAAYSEAP